MVLRAMFVVAALFLVLPRYGDCAFCLLEFCNWLQWESWSSCSRSCGGGTHRRERSPCCLTSHSYAKCLSFCELDRKDNSDSEPCNRICFNGGTWSGGYCHCSAGYDAVCCEKDVNECITRRSNCDINAVCTNTPGSFTCTCSPGFTGNGKVCRDIDECATGGSSCHTNAICNNTRGSFTCLCKPGFTGKGIACEDINECDTGGSNCHTNAFCTNSPGSFTCTCSPGYTGNGIMCTDINECAAGGSICQTNAICDNTLGSFTCICKAGFIRNGILCEDVNECDTGESNCHNNSLCINTLGSFACTCSQGYTGNGVYCNDINECTLGTHNCHTNAVCSNNDGDFDCSCNDGFDGDGVSCTDVDECTTGRSNCHTNAMCTNIPGSYECTCRIGYTGNGIECSVNADKTDTLKIVPIVISSSVVVVVVIVCLVVLVVVFMWRKRSRPEKNATSVTGHDGYKIGRPELNLAIVKDEDTVSTGRYEYIDLMSFDLDNTDTQRGHVADVDIERKYIHALHVDSRNQDEMETFELAQHTDNTTRAESNGTNDRLIQSKTDLDTESNHIHALHVDSRNQDEMGTFELAQHTDNTTRAESNGTNDRLIQSKTDLDTESIYIHALHVDSRNQDEMGTFELAQHTDNTPRVESNGTNDRLVQSTPDLDTESNNIHALHVDSRNRDGMESFELAQHTDNTTHAESNGTNDNLGQSTPDLDTESNYIHALHVDSRNQDEMGTFELAQHTDNTTRVESNGTNDRLVQSIPDLDTESNNIHALHVDSRNRDGMESFELAQHTDNTTHAESNGTNDRLVQSTTDLDTENNYIHALHVDTRNRDEMETLELAHHTDNTTCADSNGTNDRLVQSTPDLNTESNYIHALHVDSRNRDGMESFELAQHTDNTTHAESNGTNDRLVQSTTDLDTENNYIHALHVDTRNRDEMETLELAHHTDNTTCADSNGTNDRLVQSTPDLNTESNYIHALHVDSRNRDGMESFELAQHTDNTTHAESNGTNDRLVQSTTDLDTENNYIHALHVDTRNRDEMETLELAHHTDNTTCADSNGTNDRLVQSTPDLNTESNYIHALHVDSRNRDGMESFELAQHTDNTTHAESNGTNDRLVQSTTDLDTENNYIHALHVDTRNRDEMETLELAHHTDNTTCAESNGTNDRLVQSTPDLNTENNYIHALHVDTRNRDEMETFELAQHTDNTTHAEPNGTNDNLGQSTPDLDTESNYIHALHHDTRNRDEMETFELAQHTDNTTRTESNGTNDNLGQSTPDLDTESNYIHALHVDSRNRDEMETFELAQHTDNTTHAEPNGTDDNLGQSTPDLDTESNYNHALHVDTRNRDEMETFELAQHTDNTTFY